MGAGASMRLPLLCWLILTTFVGRAEPSVLRGFVVDATTERPVAARVYVESKSGEWFTVRSAEPEGAAVVYRKERTAESFEIHTSLSAHPFEAELPPGDYTVRALRGKEFVPAEARVTLGNDPVEVRLELRRWIDMAASGWYSGDTHVHRAADELPTVVLSEDLNVALPLNYWVRDAYESPAGSAEREIRPELQVVDGTHVIYPMNTEYEIFTVDGQKNWLGAFFVLNHRSPLTLGVPPVGPVAEEARRQGALLELDKHNWAWSMMLLPVMNVDLYELANNHLWRTKFFYQQFEAEPAEYMEVDRDANGMTEAGWIDFTLQNYYALLNAGFRMRPTAGTASGVHPVPLGFSRVYVHLQGEFSYEKWMEGLDAGRSFVTTGPMLDVRLNGETPGASLAQHDQSASYSLKGWAASLRTISRIEVVRNGVVAKVIEPENRRASPGEFRSPIDLEFEIDSPSWLAVRCYEETAQGRVRFAHSGPFYVESPGWPLRPRKEEIRYLIERVERELEKVRGVLPAAAVAEYEQAVERYRRIEESIE